MLTRDGNEEPLATVGIGCRLPGGGGFAESLWSLLASESDDTCVVPRHAGMPHDITTPIRSKVGRLFTRRGGFLDEIDQFDPNSSGMSAAGGLTRSTAASPAARHVGGPEDGGVPADGLAGTDVGSFRWWFHSRLSTAAESRPRQSLPVHVSFSHRDDDDDAGEPNFACLRLPRT